MEILVLIRIVERKNFALLTMALLNVGMTLASQCIVPIVKYVKPTLTIVLRNALVLQLVSTKATHITKEILSLAKMDVINVLVHLARFLVLKTHVDAIMKELHTMKETLSLAKILVILVLALLDKSLVRKIPVGVIMKELHTMKEMLSLVMMDAILVLVLLGKSLVLKTHVDVIMKVTHTMKETLSPV
jgi:hypothetical protein